MQYWMLGCDYCTSTCTSYCTHTNLLVWMTTRPVLDPQTLIHTGVHSTLLMLDKLQWKWVGRTPFAVKSSKLLSDTLRMYEPLRFSLSAWPPGTITTWNSSVCKQRNRSQCAWYTPTVHMVHSWGDSLADYCWHGGYGRLECPQQIMIAVSVDKSQRG